MRAIYILLVFAAGACAGDPVTDQAVAELGAEPEATPPGPIHRAGQPCTTCHREGGARPFAIGGTVVRSLSDRSGADGAVIDLVDAAGAKRTVIANRVGNFFVLADDWTPSWPVTATVTAPGAPARGMRTKIYREGSCNKCHRGDPGQKSVGPIVAFE
jgi:hypothetical protein